MDSFYRRKISYVVNVYRFFGISALADIAHRAASGLGQSEYCGTDLDRGTCARALVFDFTTMSSRDLPLQQSGFCIFSAYAKIVLLRESTVLMELRVPAAATLYGQEANICSSGQPTENCPGRREIFQLFHSGPDSNSHPGRRGKGHTINTATAATAAMRCSSTNIRSAHTCIR